MTAVGFSVGTADEKAHDYKLRHLRDIQEIKHITISKKPCVRADTISLKDPEPSLF